MRRWVVALVGVVVAACGGGDAVDVPTTIEVTEETQGFPVTITHAFGETPVDGPAEQVFSVSYRLHDVMYQMGVSPIGVREWWGGYPYATWPWGEEARAEVGAEPVVMDGELNIEQVAASDPDLIVALYSGITEEEYVLLSEIAPVIASSAEYPEFSTPWREEVITLGTALGKSAEAEQIIADVDAKIAQVRSEHPEFEGATIAIADYVDGSFTTYGSGDLTHQLLTELGFVIPAEFDEIAPSAFDRVVIGDERGDLLDLDVVLWYPYAKPEIEAHPMYQSLDLASEGRSIWLEDPVLEAAISFQTPLSVEFALDELAGQLEAALDGDPATSAG
jgi:iron complex transport system substrate-binding protein